MTLNNYMIRSPLNYDDGEHTSQSHINSKFGLSLEIDFEKVWQVIFTGHCKKGSTVGGQFQADQRLIIIS